MLRRVLVIVKWLASFGSACIGAVVTCQTLFGSVSEASLFLRLVLYAIEATLLLAIGRPHPTVTN